MSKLTRIAWLAITTVALATAAGATPSFNQLVGPLNKSTSGRIVCAATNTEGFPQGVILTIYDKNGAEAKTANFFPLEIADTAEIEIGPGAAGSFICIIGSQTTQNVIATLTHLNSLQQATATVSTPDPSTTRTEGSIAGPLKPGLSHKVVCKGATQTAQQVALEIRNKLGAIVASLGPVPVNALGTIETAINAAWGQQYTCFVHGLSGGKVQATIESRSSLGEPKAAASGVPTTLSFE